VLGVCCQNGLLNEAVMPSSRAKVLRKRRVIVQEEERMGIILQQGTLQPFFVLFSFG